MDLLSKRKILEWEVLHSQSASHVAVNIMGLSAMQPGQQSQVVFSAVHNVLSGGCVDEFLNPCVTASGLNCVCGILKSARDLFKF